MRPAGNAACGFHSGHRGRGLRSTSRARGRPARSRLSALCVTPARRRDRPSLQAPPASTTSCQLRCFKAPVNRNLRAHESGWLSVSWSPLRENGAEWNGRHDYRAPRSAHALSRRAPLPQCLNERRSDTALKAEPRKRPHPGSPSQETFGPAEPPWPDSRPMRAEIRQTACSPCSGKAWAGDLPDRY
jgi:hypothetical protein